MTRRGRSSTSLPTNYILARDNATATAKARCVTDSSSLFFEGSRACASEKRLTPVFISEQAPTYENAAAAASLKIFFLFDVAGGIRVVCMDIATPRRNFQKKKRKKKRITLQLFSLSISLKTSEPMEDTRGALTPPSADMYVHTLTTETTTPQWRLTIDPGVGLGYGDTVVLEALVRVGRDLGVKVRHGHGAAAGRPLQRQLVLWCRGCRRVLTYLALRSSVLDFRQLALPGGY